MTASEDPNYVQERSYFSSRERRHQTDSSHPTIQIGCLIPDIDGCMSSIGTASNSALSISRGCRVVGLKSVSSTRRLFRFEGYKIPNSLSKLVQQPGKAITQTASLSKSIQQVAIPLRSNDAVTTWRPLVSHRVYIGLNGVAPPRRANYHLASLL